MFGRAVGAGGLGFGVVRDEHASATKQCVGIIMYTQTLLLCRRRRDQ